MVTSLFLVVEGYQFLPQASAFFSKNRKLLGDHRIELVKSLSKIHVNERSIKKKNQKLEITRIHKETKQRIKQSSNSNNWAVEYWHGGNTNGWESGGMRF